jgi:hypothetical protein
MIRQKSDFGRGRRGDRAISWTIHRIIAPGLELSFRWDGDRWSHALGVGPDAVRVAESVEADAPAESPGRVVSPAYQQIDFRGDALDATVLLVGQSGPHHFSASFRVAEEPGRVTVEVDVADRVRGVEPLLACTYRVDLPMWALIDAGPSCVVWAPPSGGPGRLFASALGLPDQPTTLALAEAGRRSARMQAVAPTVVAAPSQRCRYRWRWESPPAEGS